MYQVIGLPKTLTVFGILCLIIFLLVYNMQVPVLLAGPVPTLWRAVSSSVALGSLSIYILGQTPLFPWLCRLPVISTYLPPIEGEWDVHLKSNWDVIQKRLELGDGAQLFTKTGKINIKARFFNISMEFVSEDNYSVSKTINVAVRPSDHLGLFELSYIYINHTIVPYSTDTDQHTGAARVLVKKVGDDLMMDGTYFTNRNWTKGLNTAGTVTLTRSAAVS